MNKAILHLLFVFLLLSISSCVEHEYDFEDDELDKNAVFSPDGMNVPVGDFERISILEELRKQYRGQDENPIEVNEQGILFLNYRGEMPVTFPDFENPVFEDVSTEVVAVENLDASAPIALGEYPIVPEKQTSYEIEEPVVDEFEELDITVNKVYFNSYPLNVTFYLNHLNIHPGGDGTVVLYLNFPSNFEIESSYYTEGNGRNTIQCEVNIHDINPDGSYTIDHVADVKSYTYTGDHTGLLYGVDLRVTDPLNVTAAEPTFYLVLSVDNSNIVVDHVDTYARGRETVDGVISGFDDLTHSFDNSILEFTNPSLLTTFVTNLASDFTLDFVLKTEGQAASVSGLSFLRPEVAYPSTKATSYYLAPSEAGKPADVPYQFYPLNTLFASNVPTEIAYDLNVNFDSELILYPEGLQVQAGYNINLPFDFTTIDLSISDVAEDVFDEDLYNDVLQYASENLSLEADDVEISIGDAMNVDISAVILDDSYNALIHLDHILIDNNRIVMNITGENLNLMEDARHLEFVFHLTGRGAITANDYISIKGIRLISDGGIHFEF